MLKVCSQLLLKFVNIHTCSCNRVVLCGIISVSLCIVSCEYLYSLFVLMFIGIQRSYL